MKNTLISSLLFFGGVYISLGTNKTQGTIILITLLLIVSLSLLFNLSLSGDSTENFDSQFNNFYLLPPNVFNRGAVSPLQPNNNLMAWNIDDQYQYSGGGNQIYEQMMFAAVEVGRNLPVGQTVSLRVNSGGGSSNGTTLQIFRTSPTQVRFRYNGTESPVIESNFVAPAAAAGVSSQPTNFYLLPPNVFNNGAVSPLVPNTNLMAWNIDSQFLTANIPNRIYEQFMFAVNAIGPTLQNGQTVSLRVNTGGGDSNGSTLQIVRVSPTQVRFRYNGTDGPTVAISAPVPSQAPAPALAPTCDFKDSSRCIFRGYNISGEQCDGGNGMPYNRPGLANYNQGEFTYWLRALYDRNSKGGPGSIAEAEAAREYVERCQDQPGFEYLRNVLPAPVQNLSQQVQAAQAQPVVQQPQQLQTQTALPPVQQAQGVGMGDIKCRRIIEQPPNPPFNIITGKASNTIENIQFKDSNNNMCESGLSQTGKEFTFKCPDGTNIVGYDINNQGKERPDTSIFGGFGPVYCADGTVVGTSLGRAKTQTIGQRPETQLSNYNFVDSNVLPFDDNMIGQINESSLEQCAFVCNYLKDNCGGFSYNTGNKTCGLAYSIDRAKIIPQSGGRTYQKLSNSTRK